MISGLKPYPEMKDSGVEWLGEVPVHWEVEQLGRFGIFSKGSGGTKEDEVAEGVPCVRYGDLYTRHCFFIEKTKACVSIDRAAGYTPIQYGDVLFAGSGETIEEIGKSAVNLLSDPAYCGGDVIIYRPSVTVDARFLGLATDCSQAAYQKSCMGRGITVMHIYGAELKYLSIALPPLPEQAAIVRYLEYVDRRVRRLVWAKRKLIALLTEQKQAVIHHAVTRGLDPDVPLKDSGVEWLGEVPEHWEVLQIRRLIRRGTTVTYGIVQAGPDIEGGTPYIRTSDMKGGELPRVGYLRTTSEIDASYRRSKVEPGDLVVAIRATLGKAMIVPPYLAGANLTQGTARISPGPRISSRFLFRAFNSHYCQEGIALAAKGTTFLEITLEALRRILIVLPQLDEQDAIVDHLDQATANIDTAITRTNREIELLTEYSTRLIADVVTGKLDVREAAAALPEVDPLTADDALGTDVEVDAGILAATFGKAEP